MVDLRRGRRRALEANGRWRKAAQDAKRLAKGKPLP